MKIIKYITYISLGIMKFIIVITLFSFYKWVDILYYNFGLKGILFSIGIGIVLVFHFFFIFPKKFGQIFSPTLFEDEIAENKQEQTAFIKSINNSKQKLVDDCYWGEISKEEIDKRLDQIIWEKEMLEKCKSKYPAPSQKFTLHSPQSRFQEQNPVLYVTLILSSMLFSCVLFFSCFFWIFLYHSPSEGFNQFDSYEYQATSGHWINMDDTVYVSDTGKIHLYSDCSGMKSSKEMTYEEACEAGYKHCFRCFH